MIHKNLGKSKYISYTFYGSLKETQSTLSSDPKNATPVQEMRLKLNGRYGRTVGTWGVLLLLLLHLFFHLSKRKSPYNFFPREHRRQGGKVYICQLAKELNKHGQPFSDGRFLHHAILPPLRAKAVTHPIERKRKARPRRAQDCWSWDRWLTGPISLSLPGLSLCWSDRL